MKLAKRNEQIVNLLLNGQEDYKIWEWISTISFYSALHYVKALLISHYQVFYLKIDSHKDIKTQLNLKKANSGLDSDVCDAYEQLYNYSRDMRYYFYKFEKRFNDDDIIQLAKDNYNNRLKKISGHVTKVLPKDIFP